MTLEIGEATEVIKLFSVIFTTTDAQLYILMLIVSNGIKQCRKELPQLLARTELCVEHPDFEYKPPY